MLAGTEFLSLMHIPDQIPSGSLPGAFLARELRPEGLLILCCARAQPGPADCKAIRILAGLPLDWEYLCESADKHHLVQLLYKNLSAVCPDAVPRETAARLRHQFVTNASENLKLAHVLTDLLQKFSAEDIPVIPFKGSVLANCTYGKLALRQNYDIDLFIREKDIAATDELLKAAGFRRDEEFDREARYRDDDNGVEVDVHWGFAPRYFHLPVDFEELHRHARTETLLGRPVITFSAEDFLLILCLQVVKDGWERRQQLEHLSKVCDIAEHLRANPHMQWPHVFAKARRDGLLRILHCSLILAQGLLGADLPQSVREAIETDRAAWKCARWMCRSLFSEADTLSPLENPYFSLGLRFRQLVFYLGIRERYRERIRHLAAILGLGRRS